MAWFKKQPQLQLTGGKTEKIAADDMPDLAALMNMSPEDLKDEFYLFQIQKLMKRLAKVSVRFNLPESENKKIYVNSARLKMDELLVSPAYIDSLCKFAKDDEKVPIGAIVDFPFGESLFSSKLVSVRDCSKKPVRDITVVLPTLLSLQENNRELKKQLKKLGRIKNRPVGVAFNAQDMTEEQLKRAVYTAEKTKIAFITLVFGETDNAMLAEKAGLVGKLSLSKPFNVLANVNDAQTFSELLRSSVNTVMTPYADSIGEELLKKFKIKSLKLM